MKKIAISMGDPSGIGPEICLKALDKNELYRDNCIVYGEKNILNKYFELLDIKTPLNFIDDASDFDLGKINIVNIESSKEIPIGEVDVNSGDLAFRFIKKAIEDAMEEKVSAVVTCPINKESLNKAGHHYQGHTEIFAELTGTKSYSMMLWSDKLVVDHVSTHVSLAEACARVKKDRVYECIKLLNDALTNLKKTDEIKIAVAGLNPHAGENSMFGFEERDEIIPAVEKAKNDGMNVEGPIPPDTVFHKAVQGEYDGVVCMYHDQGHIPLKLVDFYNGVNVTLGLPIIRTSVDHGTAFDIAGKGIANESSLIQAIDLAIRFSEE